MRRNKRERGEREAGERLVAVDTRETYAVTRDRRVLEE